MWQVWRCQQGVLSSRSDARHAGQGVGTVGRLLGGYLYEGQVSCKLDDANVTCNWLRTLCFMKQTPLIDSNYHDEVLSCWFEDIVVVCLGIWRQVCVRWRATCMLAVIRTRANLASTSPRLSGCWRTTMTSVHWPKLLTSTMLEYRHFSGCLGEIALWKFIRLLCISFRPSFDVECHGACASLHLGYHNCWLAWYDLRVVLFSIFSAQWVECILRQSTSHYALSTLLLK